jgi:hypothetical protein
VLRTTQGGCDFDEENAYIGFNVSRRLAQSSASDGRVQVYIGVCPSSSDPSAEWRQEVAAHGLPPQCVVWGMGQGVITVRDGDRRQAHAVQGSAYSVDQTVCVRVCGGLVEFYVEHVGAPRRVASVPCLDATLRPFVAVCGQEFQCSVVLPGIRPKHKGYAAHSVFNGTVYV